MKRIFFVLFGFQVLFAAASFEHLSPDSRLYDDLYFLLNRKIITGLDIAQKPLNRLDVAAAIAAIDPSGLETHEAWAYERLKDEFSDELDFLEDRKPAVLKPLIDAQTGVYLDDGDFSSIYNRSKIHIQGAFSLNGTLNVVSDAVFDQFAQDDPLYFGDRTTGWGVYTRESYLEYNGEYVNAEFGRDYMTWGAARNNNLLLSANAPALDILSFGLDYGFIHFSSFVSTLDDYAGSERLFAGSRLEFNGFDETLMFAANQVNIWRGGDQGLSFNFLNPSSFKYWLRMNGEGESNILFSFDGYWITPLKNRLFFEILVDDFQYLKRGPGDLEPNELGFTVGLENSVIPFIPGLELNVLYTAITNRTYNTVSPAQKYIRKNKCIGHELGNDFDLLTISLSRWHLPWLQNTLTFSYLRNGEGGVLKDFDTPWKDYTVEQGYSEPFPTGIVEETMTFSLETYVRINKYLNVRNVTSVGRILNEGNVESAAAWRWSTAFIVNAKYNFLFKP